MSYLLDFTYVLRLVGATNLLAYAYVLTYLTTFFFKKNTLIDFQILINMPHNNFLFCHVSQSKTIQNE
jgi:hypothetical protein